MTAKFVMVLLDDKGKAAPNVKLALETKDELERFYEAESKDLFLKKNMFFCDF